MDSGADPIVAFYSGGPDTAGRTLEGILAWDDERLEAVHVRVEDSIGLLQSRPANLEKSRSVVQSVAPCSIAIAARAASITSGPSA